MAATVAIGLTSLFSVAPSTPPTGPLEQRIAQLSAEVRQLEQQRDMPAHILSRHRNSICYVYAVYRFDGVSRWMQPPRMHLSGTGFVAAEGWIATNRHVAEPWWGDEEAEVLRVHGGRPKLERLLAFFPGLRAPLELTQVTPAPGNDVALAHFVPPAGGAPPPLQIAANAPEPGDAVLVLGYPMGLEGLLAKSPKLVSRQASRAPDELAAARRLSSLALIRPSATQGHIGDVVGDKLLYDASTARGASGAPVFNARGEVVGINTAYLDGFSGGTLGISANVLRPLLEKVQPANSATVAAK